MTYKAITEHVLAFGGVTGFARLTEAVKQSSLDMDAVYWEYRDYLLFTDVTAWKQSSSWIGVNRCDNPSLSIIINRLQPVTDDEA
jgi:hypothetical protein